MKDVSLCKLTCETIFMINIDEMLPKLLNRLKYAALLYLNPLLAHLCKKTVLHVQTTKMEGEPTAKNVQKGARFKIQNENEAHMLIRLALPERGKIRASVLINHL